MKFVKHYHVCMKGCVDNEYLSVVNSLHMIMIAVYSVVDRVFKAAEWILELNKFIHGDNSTTPELYGADANARGTSKRGSDVNTSQ